MAAYERALQQLYQAPLPSFLAERKRLAAKLLGEGDAAGAKEIAKRRKPTASVWAVNQLYSRARDDFDEMLAAAARLRKGDFRRTRAYHDALAKLRKRAAELLKDAGLGASDATLRRIGSTLAAIAAAGGFDPDPPGALSADRDPPGFDAVEVAATPGKRERGGAAARERPAREAARPARAQAREEARSAAEERRAARAERERLRAEDAQSRAAEKVEKQRAEKERARRAAERRRIETALRAATAKVRAGEKALAAREKQVRDARETADEARRVVSGLERKLAELGDVD